MAAEVKPHGVGAGSLYRWLVRTEKVMEAAQFRVTSRSIAAKRLPSMQLLLQFFDALFAPAI
jgi:hypothetical protein